MSLRSIITLLIVCAAAICFDPMMFITASEKDNYAASTSELSLPNFPMLQGNSLFALSRKVVKKIKVTVTAYSSTVEECDNSPFVTATGNYVREGIVAANFVPFGTRIRIPEVFGDKEFIVDDRMHPRNKKNIDIWMPSKALAMEFGKKYTYIEVLD
ncbi:MAG: hypothetical protein WC449_03920 [Candidatus Paceibacterota bacterium]